MSSQVPWVISSCFYTEEGMLGLVGYKELGEGKTWKRN
jgi:hypothetical protein